MTAEPEILQAPSTLEIFRGIASELPDSFETVETDRWINVYPKTADFPAGVFAQAFLSGESVSVALCLETRSPVYNQRLWLHLQDRKSWLAAEIGVMPDFTTNATHAYYRYATFSYEESEENPTDWVLRLLAKLAEVLFPLVVAYES